MVRKCGTNSRTLADVGYSLGPIENPSRQQRPETETDRKIVEYLNTMYRDTGTVKYSRKHSYPSRRL